MVFIQVIAQKIKLSFKVKRKVMKSVRNFAMVIATSFLFNAVNAQEKTVEVGGAAMYPSKNIVENAANSKDHTTLVAAVKAAGLAETLQGAGPFTVFAPTDAAFNMLPKGTVENLLKPENKNMLAGVLTYHVVAGRIDGNELARLIKEGNGKTELQTVAGGKLWASMNAGKVMLTDEKGGMAAITIKDVFQSNGVIHVIDHVVLPRS